jgi:cysteine desulfurase
MRKIYLDYAATSPTKPEVLEAMEPYFLKKFGNPSSLHSFGQEARAAVDKAREQIAQFLNCKPEEIIFTSGGTESDNLALRGVVYARWCHENTLSISPARKLRSRLPSLLRRSVGDPARSGCATVFLATSSLLPPHIITSAIEHHAVLHTCQDLEKQGLAEVTYLPVDKFGRVSVEDVRKEIKENTVLVSIMYANNEIGTIEPIREIGKIIEKVNRSQISNLKSQILFHTDAVQAIGYLNCDVKYLHVDMLSLSAHKFGGPKGVGVLYVKENVGIKPEITGGGQEYKKRAGTENVPGIVGLGKAIELIQKDKQVSKISKLRDKLIDGILRKIPDVILTGHPTERLPNSASFCFKYIEGESIMINLDLQGVAVSTGSACTSGSLEPSHVLIACGFDHQTAQGSIRFSLGEQTTEEDINYVLKILPPIVKRLRKMSPFGK